MADVKKKWVGVDYQGLPVKNIAAPVADTDPATKASAQAQADAAKAAAELTAQGYANTAKSEAIQAAALDATTKAATAKSEAIQAAATDATTKAGTAETNAKAYTDAEITKLVTGAPATLDTLNELAAALGDDPNFATTIATTIGTKTGKYASNITGTPTADENGNYLYLVQHDLDKADIVVQAFQGNDSVDVLVRKVDNNSLNIVTGVPLGSTTLRIVVIG